MGEILMDELYRSEQRIVAVVLLSCCVCVKLSWLGPSKALSQWASLAHNCIHLYLLDFSCVPCIVLGTGILEVNEADEVLKLKQSTGGGEGAENKYRIIINNTNIRE